MTVLQQRLNGLTIVSIEKELLVTLEYNNLINSFTSQKIIKNLNEKKKKKLYRKLVTFNYFFKRKMLKKP